MEHKPSKTVLVKEKLEPMIIEIGKIENNIISEFIFMFFSIFIKIDVRFFCTN